MVDISTMVPLVNKYWLNKNSKINFSAIEHEKSMHLYLKVQKRLKENRLTKNKLFNIVLNNVQDTTNTS